MQFDISRDFLDGILLQQPVPGESGKSEIKANGGLHFLPSSPDGTMHTAIVNFSLAMEGKEHPFAKGGWRFLFTTDERFDPKTQQDEPFLKRLLALGAGKIITVLNNLCLHANLPQVPIGPEHLVRGTRPGADAGGGAAS